MYKKSDILSNTLNYRKLKLYFLSNIVASPEYAIFLAGAS